ncbi:TPA: excisionase [Klebsiella variicola subsp. variicola]|mgnify:CR=1 FL=1|jgi:hypothetical protein|uniref:excisionase n=1 Tax=Klebsiella TaxID=570 RepID=UPI001B829E45|nr:MULTISPECIES: excisionase [Klebsiella]MCS5771204.1 excisionase [Klebsiella variicola subsp. variicola]DAQ65648.1 MAG TPA: putative excisionase [Caudoviricetes sp.]HCL6646419.1 excisionase [Raoultella ornithinolytica]MBR7601924.1 excisionase [Klebsiella variicola]HBR4317384.1 excisionase [Klebsiella pneumoniae]
MIGLECIPLKAYCHMTGELPEKVKERVASKLWRLGTHVIKVPGSRDWWIDLVEVNNWVRNYSIPLSDKELGFNLAALDEPKQGSRKSKK